MKKYTHKTRDGKILARIIATDLGSKFPIVVAIKRADEKSDLETIKQYTDSLRDPEGFAFRDLIEYSFWETVPVDTKILVKDSFSDEWYPRHFSHYADGLVYAFGKGTTSWTVSDKSCNTNDVSSWDYAKLHICE